MRRFTNTTYEVYMTKTVLIPFLVVLLIIAFGGCFPGTTSSSTGEPAGFFTGVWHGWIAPVSLIAGLFRDGIRIYEPYNTGWWYDCGFYISVIAGFGGLALSRKSKGKSSS
jgi:hypothetical protein